MTVLYDERDGVATITLNRPDVYNAIDATLAADLKDALAQAAGGPARAVVLTGSGRAFCAGADVKDLMAGYQAGQAPDLGALIDRDFNPILMAIADLPKPTLAAVNGPAAGAGIGLALACDLRIASDKATFTMAFINIGLVPDTGTAWTLPAIVGYGRAMELAYSGRQVKADEALSIGMVHRLCDPDDLAAQAHEWAATLAAGPTRAYGRTKALLRRAVESTLADAAALERDWQDSAGRSADHLEGVRAFSERRPAHFTG